MKFTKAVRKQARLRLALTGPSGSGKTLGALMIAKGLGGRLAVLDTEHGSASLYSEGVKMADGSTFEAPEFDALELAAPYSPERYIEAIRAAETAGYETLIIDSTSHEWSGSGGCLEINDKVAATKFKGNTWSAWSETTSRHRAFIDAMLQSRMHIIATGRSKTETVQNDNKKVIKLGMKTEQRDGFEYEMSLVLDIVHAGHYAMASKDRTGLFTDRDPQPITEETGRTLRAWLDTGSPLKAEPAPQGVIKPTTGAGEGMPPEIKEFLQGRAEAMIEFDLAGQPDKAADIWHDPANFAVGEGQQDEKVYLWSLLQKQSKLRAYIKDHPATDEKKSDPRFAGWEAGASAEVVTT